MAKTYTVQISDNTKTFTRVNIPNADKGETVRITAKAGDKFLLVDDETGKAPREVILQRIGNDLHVEFIDEEADEGFIGADIDNPDVVIEGYFDDDSHALVGQLTGNSSIDYIADIPYDALETAIKSTQLLEYPASVFHLPDEGALGFAPLFGLAALAAAGGGGGGGGVEPVPDNRAPDLGDDTIAVSRPENTTEVLKPAGTDPDGDPLTYSISGGADADKFVIDPKTGEISFRNPTNYENPADQDGDNVYEVTIMVSDGRGGTATQAIAVTVTDVNEAPSGTDSTVTTAEDTGYSFNASDFGFTDPDVKALTASAAGEGFDELGAVRIDTLPLDGRLTLNGVDVTEGQVIDAADIPNLVFTPDANEFGSGYASFSFTVIDGGGLADPEPNVLTIDVTPVNDAPVASPDAYSTEEDTPLTVVSPESWGTTPISIWTALP